MVLLRGGAGIATKTETWSLPSSPNGSGDGGSGIDAAAAGTEFCACRRKGLCIIREEAIVAFVVIVVAAMLCAGACVSACVGS